MNCLDSSEDTKEVENFRILFLGKNGKITGLMKQMRTLAKDDKPKLGEVVNEAKQVIEEAIEVRVMNLAILILRYVANYWDDSRGIVQSISFVSLCLPSGLYSRLRKSDSRRRK